MAQISAKNFDFWYMDGSLFLQNGYMDGWHFKNPSGTPLPRPKLSTPPGEETFSRCVIYRGGGYSHTLVDIDCLRRLLSPNRTWMCMPAGPRKCDFLYTNFLPNFPPISIPFSKEKHPILTKLGAFYNNLPKIHPLYEIWLHCLWRKSLKTPRSLVPNFAKKCPKRQQYPVSVSKEVWEPPGIKLPFLRRSYTLGLWPPFFFSHTL